MIILKIMKVHHKIVGMQNEKALKILSLLLWVFQNVKIVPKWN